MRPSDRVALQDLLEDFKRSRKHLMDFQDSGEEWTRKCKAMFRRIRLRSASFLRIMKPLSQAQSFLREWNADLMLRRYEQEGGADLLSLEMAHISFLLRDLEVHIRRLGELANEDKERADFLINRVSVRLEEMDEFWSRLGTLTTIEHTLKRLLLNPLEDSADEDGADI